LTDQNKVPFFKEILLLMIGALLTISGTLFSTYLVEKNDEKKWERRTQLHLNQNMIEQRVRLVERTMQILNKVDLLELHFILENGKTTLAKIGQGNLDDIVSNRKIIAELNSEFLTVTSLNNLYFGPKVREASQAIINATSNDIHWWQVDNKLTKNYVNALTEEMSYGITKI